ncbi:hypothetical protein, partial [Mycobacterium tuberculosis]|uniref:hypothetical protein n=1 Tax=Mycobacterium tuberculosis TaxID=1773 RepID=UPI0021C6464C
WRIPEKLMPAILEMDKARIRKAAGIEPDKPESESEYEEVTDDEDEAVEGADPEHASKRPRLDAEDRREGEEDDDEEDEEEEEEEEEEEDDAGP